MFSHIVVRRLYGAMASLVGASVAVWLGIPLPWLLGPLFVIASLRLMSAPVAAYMPLRNAGQWIIGVSLGLYFSPQIVGLIAQHWPLLVLGMLVSLVLAFMGTWLLTTFGKADLKTAWFSSAIGGASEMSILAERFNARVDLVASAHSLRVLAVVTIIPFGFEWAGITGSLTSSLSQVPLNHLHLVLVVVFATGGGLVFRRFKIASSWVLGPLCVTAFLTVNELTVTSIPSWIVNMGQLFLGWSLGDRYRPAFFKAAPRFLSVVGVFSLLSISLVFCVGIVAMRFTDLPLPTLWLGMAPGGLAEMAITAKVLMLGVPMVTAFQVSRMAFVVIITGWIYNKFLKHKDNGV
jgi:hypothetical protein